MARNSRDSVPGEELDRIRRALARAVAGICPAPLRDQAEDIVQAAMMRVLALVERGEEDRVRSSSYLWRIAHSATLDEIRRAKRRSLESSLPSESIDSKTPSAQAGPEGQARAREIGQGIEDCLSTLVPPRRHVVVLNLMGYGLAETAEVLSWPLKRVDNLLYRGMANLRRCLENKGMTP